MVESKTCPECGAELPADAPVGICPKCLLRLGIDDSQPDGSSNSDAPTLPSESEARAGAALPTDADTGDAAPIGTKIRYFGDYELLEEIARGGMGVVFKARQTSLNRIVALKMIVAGQLASAAEVQRFYTEAESAAQLDHPGIVPVFEVGEHEGQHYFSMALVHGESLAAKFVDGPLAAGDAAEIVRSVAQSVEYAHGKGVIHRDLKPSNILIDEAGQPRITDFGLAKRIDAESSLTGTGQILGTPSYMSPEQAGGKTDRIGPLSDVYSLGAILYTLLTGRPPFQSTTPTATLIQVLQQEPVSPRALNAKAPRDLETICLKCLEKEPRRRYASAGELAAELNRYLTGEPIQARPIGSAARLWRWCRRKPAMATVSALALFATVAGIVTLAVATIVVTKSRNEARNLAKQEKVAREEAVIERENVQDALARSLYEQARALRMGQSPGHRGRVLELLEQAESLRARPRQRSNVNQEGREAADIGHPLPNRDELRSEALAALLNPDAYVVRKWSGSFHSQTVSRDGQFACLAEIRLSESGPSFPVSLLNLETGELLHRWDNLPSSAMALGPRGKVLAVADDGGLVRLWKLPEAEAGKSLKWPPVSSNGNEQGDSSREISKPSPSGGQTQQLAFSQNGRHLAAIKRSGSDLQVAIWDLQGDTAVLIEGKAHGTRGSNVIDISPDNAFLAFASATDRVRILNLESGEVEHTVRLANETTSGPLGWSPDGKRLAIATFSEKHDETSLLIWDLEANRERHRIRTPNVIWTLPLSFSPDGNHLAAAMLGGAVIVYQLDTQEEVLRLDQEARPNLLQWTVDGQGLFCGVIGLLKRWQVNLDRPLRQVSLQLPENSIVRRFDISPDRQSVAVAVGTFVVGQENIQLYQLPSGEFMISVPESDRASDLTFDAAGKHLLFSRDVGVTLFDLQHDKQLAFVKCEKDRQQNCDSIAIVEDSRALAAIVGSDSVAVWDVTAEQLHWSIEPSTAGSTSSVVLSPDGRWLAQSLLPDKNRDVADRMRAMQIWNAASRQVTAKIPEQGPIASMVFSQHGKWLFGVAISETQGNLGLPITSDSGGSLTHLIDGQQHARVWDAATGDLQLDVELNHLTAAAFSPDDRLLVIRSRSGSIDLWDVERAERLLRWELPMTGNASSIKSLLSQHIQFTPDGRYLAASTGRTAGEIQMLDLQAVHDRLTEIDLGW